MRFISAATLFAFATTVAAGRWGIAFFDESGCSAGGYSSYGSSSEQACQNLDSPKTWSAGEADGTAEWDIQLCQKNDCGGLCLSMDSDTDCKNSADLLHYGQAPDRYWHSWKVRSSSQHT
ncbi:hypothetical protein VI817_000278 [Penicillium citrinum]|uniref:Uncharacterized protein n=1 Tax=Penicillium hetheringtonii TaxID=911720 RepID=A0AAD6E272_9EURO|nr:hypothetical protein N7450_000148 [Penicillium hetheringtonii]KAK5806020.1 hypothetical protein VI817_000278 [Penicillium citrinum]